MPSSPRKIESRSVASHDFGLRGCGAGAAYCGATAYWGGLAGFWGAAAYWGGLAGFCGVAAYWGGLAGFCGWRRAATG